MGKPLELPALAFADWWLHLAGSPGKVNLYSDSDVTFLLTSGGHNAALVRRALLRYERAAADEHALEAAPGQYVLQR